MFIYLLIPAFFVVCCYLKGTEGGSLGDFLSANVVCEQNGVEYSKDTYVYKKEVKKEDNQQKTFVQSSITDSHLTSYHCTFHPSPTIVSATLRGPPSLI